MNRRPTVYETVALPLSYIGLRGTGAAKQRPEGLIHIVAIELPVKISKRSGASACARKIIIELAISWSGYVIDEFSRVSMIFRAMSQEPQLSLEFRGEQSEIGFQGWLNERRRALSELAQKLGLPLGHEVEIWLKGDVRLTGRLELAEPPLIVPPDRNPKMELRIDRCTFTPADIEACVRLD